MKRALFFSKSYYVLFCIAVFSIPFTYLLYFYLTPLLLIFWIIEQDWINKWSRIKESQTTIITCTLLLYWFLNVIGLLYSNDLLKGLMRTYDKLPFLVYPLVFFTLDKTFFTLKKFHTLFKLFLWSTSLMLLTSWGYALWQYIATGKTYHFFYNNLSHFFGHPAYCALIVCLAFCILFYFFNQSSQTYRWAWFGLMFFFAVSIYFYQSRSCIFAFFAILLFTIFYFVLIQNKQLWRSLPGVIIVLIFIFTIINLFPNRVGAYKDKIKTEQFETKNFLGQRSEIWSICYKLAMENKIIGIGSGYQNESYLTYTELEIIDKSHLFINAHNQFLQSFLDHGVVGLIVLVFLVIYFFYFALKTQNYLLFMLMIGLLVNVLFESMLERNHGIFIFCLFSCLFIAKNNIFATDLKNGSDKTHLVAPV